MILNKRRAFLEKKLIEFFGKSKYIWKALNSLVLPNKICEVKISCEVKALKIMQLNMMLNQLVIVLVR